jgi:hypothetical protein
MLMPNLCPAKGEFDAAGRGDQDAWPALQGEALRRRDTVTNVCCCRNSGKYLLAASISHFDPKQTCGKFRGVALARGCGALVRLRTSATSCFGDRGHRQTAAKLRATPQELSDRFTATNFPTNISPVGFPQLTRTTLLDKRAEMQAPFGSDAQRGTQQQSPVRCCTRAQKSTNANVRKSLSNPFRKRGIERDPKIRTMHEQDLASQMCM